MIVSELIITNSFIVLAMTEGYMTLFSHVKCCVVHLREPCVVICLHSSYLMVPRQTLQSANPLQYFADTTPCCILPQHLLVCNIVTTVLT